MIFLMNSLKIDAEFLYNFDPKNPIELHLHIVIAPGLTEPKNFREMEKKRNEILLIL